MNHSPSPSQTFFKDTTDKKNNSTFISKKVVNGYKNQKKAFVSPYGHKTKQ